MSNSPAVAQAVISAQATRIALNAAIAKAEELGVIINAAMFDSGCNLAGFLRMPGAFNISIDLAMAKARTAAGLGIPMSIGDEVIDQEDPRVRRGLEAWPEKFSPIHGGLPVYYDKQLLGGLGCSGAAEAEDLACAQAGIDAINEYYGG